MILPMNISAAVFAKFLKESEAVVGVEWVKQGEESEVSYGRIRGPFEYDDHMPSAAVCPRSIEELQAIVTIAAQYSIPIWPVSTGRNIGYGTTSVADRGTVVLDLRRLNKITDFDPELGTLVVEPGVTYQQLQDFIKESGYDFWIDFPGPGPIVSPLGNTLERGHGLTPYGDHFAHSCGYEVLLTDGTLFRTGFGGNQNSKLWQINRHGFGPSLEGLFTQSNFGIVTKMGIWLMPAPESFKTILAIWPEYDDIDSLVSTVRGLRMDNTIGNEGVMGNAGLFLAGSGDKRSKFSTSDKAMTRDQLISKARSVKLGAWNYVFSLYGRDEQVALNWKYVKQQLEESGATLIPDIKDGAQNNELSLKAFTLFNWLDGGDGIVWFSPTAPAKGSAVKEQCDMAHEIMLKYNLEMMSGVAFEQREALNVMPLLYDRRIPGRIDEVRQCFDELVDAFGKAGYGLYRTSIGFMDQVAGLQGDSLGEVNRRIKQALDPKGILAPGKSGIRL